MTKKSYNKQNKKIDKLEQCNINLLRDLEIERDKNKNFLNLKHEVARLNAIILTLSETISLDSNKEHKGIKEYKNTLEKILEKINTIFHTSSMISSRMTFADLESNPEALEKHVKFDYNVYKKFDKARYILFGEAKKMRKNIKFEGNTYFTIEAISALDCLPFILLDNAVKYAPQDTDIIVEFIEDTESNLLEVIVASNGPLVSSENIQKLTDRCFRDESASKTSIQGEGLGLYIANTLCDIHNISLTFSSDPIGNSIIINQTQYGEFKSILKFQK